MRVRTASSRPRGLTAVETIVVVFVFSLLLVSLISLLNGGIKAWKKAQVRNKLRADARAAVDQIAAEFRQNQSSTIGSLNTTAPATPNPTVDNVLSFTRYDNDGSTYNVVYTINDTAHTVDRYDSKTATTTVIAENVVGLQPGSATTRYSYFQWADPGPSQTTMIINLQVADYNDDVNSIPSQTVLAQRDSVTLRTSAYFMAANKSAANTIAPAAFSAPTDLRDPRRLARGRPDPARAGPRRNLKKDVLQR